MREFPFEVRSAARLYTSRILALPNVIAVGVAHRRVGGRVTDEPGVVTYVTHKVPLEALRLDERVPPTLDADGAEVRTDVVEAPIPHFVAVDTSAYRPLRGGCQIGVADGGAGTAGAVMYDRRDQQIVLLTNNHVLTQAGNPTTLPVDTRVWQPHGGAEIGRSKRIVPMFLAPLGEFGYRFSAQVDAGIVSVDPALDVTFDVVEIAGRHPYVVLPPLPGLEVVRRGYRTQLRTGTVEAIDVTTLTRGSNGDLHSIGGPGAVFTIRSPERLVSAMPGDSGSLVVDADGGAARGLVFSSDSLSGGLTWACELGTVMTALELDTPCTGALNGLIRRSVFRRFPRASVMTGPSVTGGIEGVDLVAGLIRNMATFRSRHLTGATGCGGLLGAALHRLAPDLAQAITADEDVAGLLDRTFGEWLVQPTVFDLLEYRFADDVAHSAAAAFGRLSDVCPRARQDVELLGRLFQVAGGRTMRELLAREMSEEVL